MNVKREMPRLRALLYGLVDNVRKVIVGKDREIRLGLTASLGGGHLLLEDVPGTGKSMFARALAQSIAGEFKRIQCVPDLLPSDITGYTVYNRKTGDYEFKLGPLFANIVLADEINRATPKTQAAFLEAMGEEKQVTVDGSTYVLPNPFFVLATENPVEFEGTFNLPEAQLDRFFIRMSLGHPDIQSLVAILKQENNVHPIRTIKSVMRSEDFLGLQEAVKHVYVDDTIEEFLALIVHTTQRLQEYPDICIKIGEALGVDLNGDSPLIFGASTRGAETLHRAAQVAAFFDERDFVIPADVRQMAVPTLNHRVKVSSAVMSDNDNFRRMKLAEILIEVLVAAIPDPPLKNWKR